jgi:undecaprenyl diphosphate synthase
MHIGLILDGNRRWATKQGLSHSQGHKQGAKQFLSIANYLYSKGVSRITAYVLSVENLSRSAEELAVIYELFGQFLSSLSTPQKRATQFADTAVCIRVCGDTRVFPSHLLDHIKLVEQTNPAVAQLTIDFAFCYGGQQEIVHAVESCLAKHIPVTVKTLLDQCLIPHSPDLIIRTGGQYRLSNFLLFQSAYSEWFFEDVLWPDLTHADIERILQSYATRVRNFGK